MIEKGEVNTTLQDDTLATPAPKIFKGDCKINWTNNSLDVHNFIRGLSPYPASYTYLDNKIVKIFRTKLTNISINNKPSVIQIKDKKFFVNTNDSMLEILELQPEGKKRMSANDFINGIIKNMPRESSIEFHN